MVKLTQIGETKASVSVGISLAVYLHSASFVNGA